MLIKFIVTIWQFAVFWASSGSWLMYRFFVFSTLTSSGAEVCCGTEASPSPSIYLLWLIIIIVFLLACYNIMFASYPASISDNIDRPGKVFVSVKKSRVPFSHERFLSGLLFSFHYVLGSGNSGVCVYKCTFLIFFRGLQVSLMSRRYRVMDEVCRSGLEV